jgi:hypothetical protein
VPAPQVRRLSLLLLLTPLPLFPPH